MDLDDFIGDDRTIYAVERCFQIIGEAVKKLPPDFCDQYPIIPWRDMAKFRDKIVHDYGNVDLSIIWTIIKNDVPVVINNLSSLVMDNPT